VSFQECAWIIATPEVFSLPLLPWCVGGGGGVWRANTTQNHSRDTHSKKQTKMSEEVTRKWVRPEPELQTAATGRILLGPVDLAMPPCYSPFAWFWKKCPDGPGDALVAHLEASLLRLLTVGGFAPLAGTLRSTDSAAMEVTFGMPDDRGALFVVARAPDCSDFFSSTATVAAPASLFEVPDASAVSCPVLALKVTLCSDSSLVVSVSVHHRVCDGVSIATFVSRLLATAQPAPPQPPPSFSRDCFPHQIALGQATGPGMSNVSLLTGAVVRHELFSKAELATLKLAASPKPGDADQRWISTKDALLAHIWRCLVSSSPEATDMLPNSPLSISLACNLRKRLSLAATTSYIGNAVIVCLPSSSKQGPTRERLLNGTLREAALFIRETVEHAQAAPLQELLDGMASIVPNFRFGIDVTSSDWTALDFYGCKLDGRPPDRVAPMIAAHMPGLVNLIQQSGSTDEGAAGVLAYIHVSASQNANLQQSGALHHL
jgi:hypothetical protein